VPKSTNESGCITSPESKYEELTTYAAQILKFSYKFCKGYASVGHLYFETMYNYHFLGPIPQPGTDGVKYGKNQLLYAKFHSHRSVQRATPVGQKTQNAPPEID